MDAPRIFQEPTATFRHSELDQISAAWRDTVLRLEQTHEALRGEISRLGDELEERNRELARQNRLADLGQMAAHLAQEVHHNLAPITMSMSLLRRRLSNDSGSVDILDKIEAGLLTLDSSVNDLLHFAFGRSPKPQWINVRQIVDDVCNSLAHQFDAQDIELTTDVPKHLGLLADRDMFRSAVVNLAINSLDAMPEGGRLVVTSYIGRGGLELEVADSGPGLSDEVRQRAFEPFFTTKRDGAGLGLAVVHRIAEAHGGDVLAMNCPEGGAAFTLRFPDRAREAAA